MLEREYETLRAVEDVHWWYAVLRRLVLESLQRRFAPGIRLLDAGCGTGGMLDVLQRRGWAGALHGVDLSPEAVRQCRDRGLGEVCVGRVEKLPFADDAFDAVLSLDVLYHAGVEEGRALAEMGRVLRPGGVLLVNVAAFECLRGRHDTAVCGARRYKSSQLRSLLAVHRLEVEEIFYWNAWLFLPLWIWRSWTRRNPGQRKRAGSEMQLPPPWLNGRLKGPAWVDANLCRLLRLPFGSSILAVARKR